MAFFHVFFVLMACIGGLTVLVLINYMVHIILAKHPNKDSIQRTNADRIRGMSDEELAHLLHSAEEHLFTGNLWNYDKWTEWLKQEASDET